MIASGVEPNEKWEAGPLSDSDDEGSADSGVNAAPVGETSELEELFKAIRTANSSLMKLSMVIRNSPARDDYLKAASRYKFDPMWDVGHVKEKHGRARGSSEWLVERLGKAITRRRQYLKYREDHHGKLSRDWDDTPKDGEAQEDDKPEKTIMASTKATTFIETKQVMGKGGPEIAGSFVSQTSYEPTVASEATEGRLTVPPPPKMAFEGVPFEYGEPFQCPYCYTEQIVNNKSAWKYVPCVSAH